MESDRPASRCFYNLGMKAGGCGPRLMGWRVVAIGSSWFYKGEKSYQATWV